ncbi:MAG: FecR domain-containing protein [Sneathiellales bacterium]|nr:FecR domain-containing protein [Sneathiellales bacterium]
MKAVAEYLADLKELSISEQADFWVIALEDGMDDAKETAFRFWLADSPEHRTAYNSSLDIWRLAGQAAASKTPAANNRTAPYSPPPQSLRRFRFAHWMTAGLAALVLSAFLYSSDILQPENLTAAGSGFKTLSLHDGSTAIMASGASLAVNFSEKARKIDLKKGGVFVDVTPNKNRPFSVSLGSLEATAIGTAYSVEHTITGPLISVHEGVVKVSSREDSHAPILLKAGQSWTTETDFKSGRVQNRIFTKRSYWKEELLQVEHAKLVQVLEKFSNYLGEEIIWIDPDLAKTEISGLFQMRNSEQLLEILASKYGVEKYSLFGKSIFLQKKS